MLTIGIKRKGHSPDLTGKWCGLCLADQLQPSGSVEIPQLIHIVHGPLLGHIVDDDLKDAIEHPTGDDVAQLGIQLGL